MRNLVCATRGGEGSRAAQLAAIAQAKAENAALTFLYVVDPHSLRGVDDSLETAVSAELHWMGQTLLRIAQNRAHAAGLSTEISLRHGRTTDQICQFLQDTHADLLILGTPRGTTANVFGDDAIEQFATAVEQQTNVPVKLIHPDSVAQRSSSH
ncbi:MAG: universal stress protein [Anaerolineales bacterium]|nr:universal stress protein [Anaerolineales bacterium]